MKAFWCLAIGVFLACGVNSAAAQYAGWTVGGDYGGPGIILRSTDSGNTWTRQGVGQIADVQLGGVFAVDPYTAWVVGPPEGGYATIYHTTDGGNTWERKGSPNIGSPDYVPNTYLIKVHASGDDVWAVGYGTILHTSDGGATWTEHIPAGYESHVLQGVYAVDGNTVWATGSLDRLPGTTTILKTTDAGETWTLQEGGDVYDADHILGISAADADTAWAVGGNYVVLKTIDGGANWTRDPYFGGIYDVNEVYAVSTSTVWVAGDNGIYWSTDGGLNWDEKPAGLYIMGVCAVSSQEAWASGVFTDRSIYHTTDGGTTWTRTDQVGGEPLLGLYTISFATQPITDYLIALMQVVLYLTERPDLNLTEGQGNALLVKLEHAFDRLNNNRTVAAANVLGAFANQVMDLMQDKLLPFDEGWELFTGANDIIELLGGRTR